MILNFKIQGERSKSWNFELATTKNTYFSEIWTTKNSSKILANTFSDSLAILNFLFDGWRRPLFFSYEDARFRSQSSVHNTHGFPSRSIPISPSWNAHHLEGMLLCFIDPRVRKIRNEASSCPGIFSRTLRFYYVASSPGRTALLSCVIMDTTILDIRFRAWTLSWSLCCAGWQRLMARTGGESSLDAIIKRGRTSGLDAVVLSRALSGLGKIFALTVGTDGTIFGCTSCAIYTIAKDGGFLGHLAGSHTEMGYKDGRGTDARCLPIYVGCFLVVFAWVKSVACQSIIDNLYNNCCYRPTELC